MVVDSSDNPLEGARMVGTRRIPEGGGWGKEDGGEQIPSGKDQRRL